MTDLTGRVALVTGGSRGIGRAIALALAAAGCDVAVGFHRTGDAAHDIAAQITTSGRRALAVGANVAHDDEVRRMVREVEGALGSVDILVNNAGIARPQPPESITLDDWREILDTNLTSAFLASQAVLPSMRERRWGRLIMLSSVAAQLGGVIGPHYAASKAGLHGLVHSYAALLAKEGITANAIAPALVDTDMIRNNPKVRPELLPVGRFGHVDEVADMVVALAKNGYITGQTINVNGGWYMS